VTSTVLAADTAGERSLGALAATAGSVFSDPNWFDSPVRETDIGPTQGNPYGVLAGRGKLLRRMTATLVLIAFMFSGTGCIKEHCLKKAGSPDEVALCEKHARARKTAMIVSAIVLTAGGAAVAASKNSGGGGAQPQNCQGCCAYHRGVRCYDKGYVICNDGAVSPTCRDRVCVAAPACSTSG
jgi:hypothetical protein